MKIQFINPGLGGDYSMLDIAITSLATYINERTSHNASLIDLTFHRRNWKSFLKINLERNQPDVIGISCTLLYMKYVKEIIKEIKKCFSIPVILGGYYPSISPEEAFSIPEVDAICIGDGEYALQNYLDCLSNKETLEGIDGIWSKQNNKIIKNKNSQFITNIDQLPVPNWDIWQDLDKYFYFLQMLYLIGSRGCPYKCTFCSAYEMSKAGRGKYLRVKNPKMYAQEITELWQKYKLRGPKIAQLFDNTFTTNEKWLSDFCSEYRNLKTHKEFKYSVFSRVDHLDKNKIELLGSSGCCGLRIGIESGDSYVRNKIYEKDFHIEKAKIIFKLCKKNNIRITALYILGGPGETINSMNKTIYLAQELKANKSAFFIYKPLTKVSLEQISKYGGKLRQNWLMKTDNIDFGIAFQTNNLSPTIISLMQKKAYFLTFGPRLLRTLRRQKIMYFFCLIVYLVKGVLSGLNLRYLLVYFHAYGFDNIEN